MKASYNWLKEFVEFDLSPDELAHTLTMAGFEVEEIIKLESDVVFDFGVTPNRPDCLSVRGLAREVSTILEIPLKDLSPNTINAEGEGPAVIINDNDLCYRYSSRVIKGVKIASSPEWLKKRLESCGINPISNIVDVTNYILLELGQPLHAFDLEKLFGRKIIVERAGETKKFVTLDDEERPLSKDMLLINDSEKPIAIAGIMGGKNSEVSESTVNILLESACFKPSSIRRASKDINLSTESSYRFERGVDVETVPVALDRAARMIAELAGGEISRLTDIYPNPLTREPIKVSAEKISALIGVELDGAYIEKTLSGLGFKIERAGGLMKVVPPTFREDVQGEIDIVEEIARLYGYDNIPATMPNIQMVAAPVHKTQEMTKKIKLSLVKSGFSEVINFSFMNPDILDKLNLASDDRRRETISLNNPLRKEESVMRTSLVPALLNNIGFNLRRGERSLRFFEVSRVFLSSDQKLPDEVLQLAIVFHKDKGPNLWQGTDEGFYDVKGIIENLVSDLKIRDVSFTQNSVAPAPYLHPGKCCSIMINDKKIGSIGVLHPGVSEALDLSGDITIGEINNLSEFIDLIPKEKSFTRLPKQPYVERDLAIIVDNELAVSDIISEIHAIDSEIIESVNLFDIYRGKPIPDDKKSLAFSVRYRSADKTLTDSEVDAVHSSLIERLETAFKAELRSS